MSDTNDQITDTTADDEAAPLPQLPPDVEPTGEPTEDELARLSPEERAALGGGDDDDFADDDGDEEGLPEGFALTKEELAAITYADDPGDDGEDDAAPPKAQEEAQTAQPAPVAPDQAMLDAAFKAATESAAAKRQALFDAYEDGEHTREEYVAKLAEIDAGIAAEATAQVQRQIEEAQTQAFAT